jgi:hypothetical protein
MEGTRRKDCEGESQRRKRSEHSMVMDVHIHNHLFLVVEGSREEYIYSVSTLSSCIDMLSTRIPFALSLVQRICPHTCSCSLFPSLILPTLSLEVLTGEKDVRLSKHTFFLSFFKCRCITFRLRT